MSILPISGHYITTLDGKKVHVEFKQLVAIPHAAAAREDDPDAKVGEWSIWYEYTDGAKHNYRTTQQEGAQLILSYDVWNKDRR